jgi:hypothetical protein
MNGQQLTQIDMVCHPLVQTLVQTEQTDCLDEAMNLARLSPSLETWSAGLPVPG